MAVSRSPHDPSIVDVAAYQSQGYLAIDPFLDSATLGALRATVEQLTAAAGSISQSDAMYDLEPNHRPAAPRVRRLKNPDRHASVFRDVLKEAPIAPLLSALLGPSYRLLFSKVNMKPSHGGSPVQWHQDFGFNPHTNDDLLTLALYLG